MIALLLMPSLGSSAQELEYNMELGVLAGGSFYMGDANYTALFKETSILGGVMARYNINPRMVVKGNLAIGKIKGSTEGNDNVFPDNGICHFNRNVYELGGQFEYNFFAYGTGAGYKDSHRMTPYILLGAGLAFVPKPAEHVIALSLPIGIGVKYKLAERLNIGAEWTMRLTTSDKLDVSTSNGLQLNNPYEIKGRGLKNKDSYSWLFAYISYDLFPKYRKCNN